MMMMMMMMIMMMMMSYFPSAILFSLIFGQVSAILQQGQKNTAKYHSIIDNMKQFSKLYKLPTQLATRTIDFFMSTWAMNKGIDTDEVTPKWPSSSPVS